MVDFDSIDDHLLEPMTAALAAAAGVVVLMLLIHARAALASNVRRGLACLVASLFTLSLRVIIHVMEDPFELVFPDWLDLVRNLMTIPGMFLLVLAFHLLLQAPRVAAEPATAPTPVEA